MNRKGAKGAKSIAMKRSRIEHIGRTVVDASIRVHRVLGPGLLESAYQLCLAYELRNAGLVVACEKKLPVIYGEILIDAGYRMGMLVDNAVVVENKTVECLMPIHEAQLLTDLRLGGYRLGYLLNWHMSLMRQGIKRMVLDL